MSVPSGSLSGLRNEPLPSETYRGDRHAAVYLRRLRREQLRLALLSLVAFGGAIGALPLILYLLPGLHDAQLLGVPLPIWLVVVPPFPLFFASACSSSAAPTASTKRSATSSKTLDAGIIAVVAVTGAALGIGTYGVRLARTTSDLFVASRAVSPWWNAAAISGEYLSAASFLGVSGLMLKFGASALWLPGRLHRGLPHAAAVRRRAAAAFRLLHDPRLRRGPAARAATCGCSRRGSCC